MRLKSRILLVFIVFIGFSHAGMSQKNGNLQDDYQVNIERTNVKIIIDGDLSEAVWQTTAKATDFWMSFPIDDRRVDPEFQTEVMITYDETYIYVAAICKGPAPYFIPTLKRDNFSMWSGDMFGIVLDPINEKTNGFVFGANPAGVQTESLITGQLGSRASGDFSGINGAWDNKWFVETKTYDDYWAVEMAIPFKSLRFGNSMDWGINFIRGEPKTNSFHTWSPVPVQFITVDLGYNGKLIWDQTPAKTKSNISISPYVLGGVFRDIEGGEDATLDTRAGLDAKVAVTSSLNLDLTINPDFSQVDVDQQVTNLTTVNLRFPEQRLFFLENSDLFSNFGIQPMRPFFSRRIGLDADGKTIPILFGARLSGNITKSLRMGLMNTQTKEVELPGNNYTSLVLHQRLFKRSIVKGYFHNRQAFSDGESVSTDYNRVGGLEFKYRSFDGKWQGFGGYGFTITDEYSTENYFYNVGGGYEGRGLNFYVNMSGIGDHYLNDFGFMPRRNHYDAENDTIIVLGFDHWYTRAGYNFYPKNSIINQHGIKISNIVDITTISNELIGNNIEGVYNINFSNTSKITVGATHEDINLLYPFGFTDGEPLPVGLYHFNYGELTYESDGRRDFGVEAGLLYGGFYNGTRLQYSLNLSYRIQPWGNFSMNFVQNDLNFPDPYGDTRLFLVGPKAEVNFSRNMYWTTFLQYNTQRDNFNINSRLQWRYLPMSDLFIVYSDNYTVDLWGSRNRALVIKLNYWLNL